MLRTTREKLESIAWDFADAKTGLGPHAIHPYPAKFIPQIPRTLIKLFHPGDDSVILDPFCGSGTTLVEASDAGLPSIGIDLNPLASLLAKVKVTPVGEQITRVAREVVVKARQRFALGSYTIPPIPRIDHWFLPQAQSSLACLITEINKLRDPDVADALKIAFSSIVVRVSNQDSDTRYAAVEKVITEDRVFSAFEKAAASISAALLEGSTDLFTKPGRVRVLNKDLMTVEPDEIGTNVGLVITSPPYPNAYEYWLYHKYRMYWLGMDPIPVREAEIGARPHYFKKNHQTADDFERQMGRCFWLLSKVMKAGGHACFVVGRSIIHGVEIDNEALLERAAAPHGFHKSASVFRKIASTRKSFNLSHGTINREQVVVFALRSLKA